MKNNYKGFRGWLNYIRDYKDNVDNDLISEQRLIDANKEIEKLNNKIKDLEFIGKVNDELIKKQDGRIQELNKKYSSLRKGENEKFKEIEELQQFINQLTNDLEETEYRRRVNATEIGHKQRKINKLEKEKEELKLEIAKKDHMINFLKSSKHAPTKEEIIAYETQMKEVEKRQKNK